MSITNRDLLTTGEAQLISTSYNAKKGYIAKIRIANPGGSAEVSVASELAFPDDLYTLLGQMRSLSIVASGFDEEMWKDAEVKSANYKMAVDKTAGDGSEEKVPHVQITLVADFGDGADVTQKARSVPMDEKIAKGIDRVISRWLDAVAAWDGEAIEEEEPEVMPVISTKGAIDAEAA